MVPLSKHWSSERGYLLSIAFFTFTAIVLSSNYVAATGRVDSFIAIIGTGVLLISLVAVPSLLFENEQESH